MDAESFLNVLENEYVEDSVAHLPPSEELTERRNEMRLQLMRYNRNYPGSKPQQDNDDTPSSVEYVEPTEFGYPGLEYGMLGD